MSVVIPVFEDGRAARAAVDCVFLQVVAVPELLEVIVVDDGSTSDVSAFFKDLDDRRIRLHRLPDNRGRSAARNAGATLATGEVLIFMDCDCQPDSADFIASHAENLARGHVASTGHIVGTGGTFWDRYQAEASTRRERQFRQGEAYTGSSQNLAVRTSAFRKVGGFDEEYRHYGFEDRDLLIRLSEVGTISWAEAAVRHLDTFTLSDVCRKMVEAGKRSSGRFCRNHPAAYRKLGYAAIDARLRPWLRPFGATLGPLLLSVTAWLDALLRSPLVPYTAKKSIVKLSSAMAFAYGTGLNPDFEPVTDSR